MLSISDCMQAILAFSLLRLRLQAKRGRIPSALSFAIAILHGTVHGMVMTVRFVYKGQAIRIFGAGYWRKGRKIYEKAQS